MKKAVYSLLYNLVVAAFPLVALPLAISRTSLADYGSYLGAFLAYTVSLTVSITAFSAFAGRAYVHAQETGGVRSVFRSLLAAQLILVCGALVVYCALLLVMSTGRIVGAWPLSLALASSCLNVDWYFYAVHDYRSILIRNTVVRGVGLAMIYLLVIGEGAISRFAIIMAGILIASNVMGFVIAWRRQQSWMAEQVWLTGAWNQIVQARHLLMSGSVAASYQQLDQVIVKAALGEVAVAKLNILKQVVYMACAVTNAYCRYQTPNGIRSVLRGSSGEQFRRSLLGFLVIMAVMGGIGIMFGAGVLNLLSAAAGAFTLVDVLLVAASAGFISCSVFIATQVNVPLSLERNSLRANLMVAVICLALLSVLPGIYGYRGAMLAVGAGEFIGLVTLVVMSSRVGAWKRINK